MNVNYIIGIFNLFQKIESFRSNDSVVMQHLPGHWRMTRKNQFIKNSNGYIIGGEEFVLNVAIDSLLDVHNGGR